MRLDRFHNWRLCASPGCSTQDFLTPGKKLPSAAMLLRAVQTDPHGMRSLRAMLAHGAGNDVSRMSDPDVIALATRALEMGKFHIHGTLPTPQAAGSGKPQPESSPKIMPRPAPAPYRPPPPPKDDETFGANVNAAAQAAVLAAAAAAGAPFCPI